MQQLTLESLGVKRKRVCEESESSSSKKKCVSKKERSAWNDAWYRTYPWLEKVKDSDCKLKAMCTWCKDAKRTNAMATVGSPNLQSSIFSRHESTRDHLLSAEAHNARRQKTNIQHVVESLVAKDVSIETECDSSKEAQMNTMYYVAKEGQPLNQYNKVLKLQIKNKCPDLQDPKRLYTSEESKIDLLNAINMTIEETVDANIKNSDFIGLIVDESTDISVHKKLNVYVQCVNKDSDSVIHFMDCVNVPDGKADTIVSEIVKLFVKKDIPFSKLMTLASDGAAVMTGRLNGVGVKLRQHSPTMMQIHCVAHKLALAAGQACMDISLFNEYQHSLKLVYRYFSNSAVRYSELRAMIELMDNDDMEYLTLKEPASFRWLSLEGAVRLRAILDCYPAVYNTLEHDAAKGSSEAKGLFNRVKSVVFVLVSGFLKDVLGVIGKLSKVFQRDNIDVGTVNIMVEATQLKLQQLKCSNGPELDKLYNELDSGSYREVKLLDKQNLRIQFQNESTKYLDKLTGNLEERFEKETMKTLQLLNTVLNPQEVPKNATDLESYGEEELRELIDHYSQQEGLLDGERAKGDFFQVKVVLKSMNCSLTEACKKMVRQYSDTFPDFTALANIVLVSPVTSVACERGFSVHNKIKTKGHCRLKHETVTILMRVKEEGPELQDFDPKPSVVKFCDMKKRRK